MRLKERTAVVTGAGGELGWAIDRLVAMTPGRRMGQMVDMAKVVLSPVSDESAHMSRQVIHLAGGMEGF